MTSRTTLTFRQAADHFSPDMLAAMIADLAQSIALSGHAEGHHNTRTMIDDLSDALILNVGTDEALQKMFRAFRQTGHGEAILNLAFG